MITKELLTELLNGKILFGGLEGWPKTLYVKLGNDGLKSRSVVKGAVWADMSSPAFVMAAKEMVWEGAEEKVGGLQEMLEWVKEGGQAEEVERVDGGTGELVPVEEKALLDEAAVAGMNFGIADLGKKWLLR